MRILHLASGNRWTGAAAPAFAEVEALRIAGIDAHYAYVGGYKLEEKIGHLPFAHAVIERRQNPFTFARTVRDVCALGTFDVVHSHLTWDHVIAAAVARKTGARLARTFHARRVIRRDPLSRLLVSRTELLFAVNREFSYPGRRVEFTPPPLDHRQFTPDGADVRSFYGFTPGTPVVTVIGKLAQGRGFELALESFAEIRRSIPAARLLVIGHGPHRPVLEQLSQSLGIDAAVTWAGYHETDLAEHYRAADVLLFTEKGSDEGHRAVLEAMACGTTPVAAPIEGIEALLENVPSRLVATSFSASAIAAVALPLLAADRNAARHVVVNASRNFGYEPAAARLLASYGRSGAPAQLPKA